MAKATITVPSRVYAADTRDVELPNLTSDDAGVKIQLTRENWADTGSPVVFGIIQGSNDNGATRFELCSFAYVGGVMVNKFGQTVTVCGPTCYWTEHSGVPQRPGRVWLNITNTVSLRTAITLTGA
jgi:hypothetical protein